METTTLEQGATKSTKSALANDAEAIRGSIMEHLRFTLAELPEHVEIKWDPYLSLSLAVLDLLIENWIRTQERYYERDAKRVYYLSLEFLMGRTLGNALLNLGIEEACADALHELGYTLEDLREA